MKMKKQNILYFIGLFISAIVLVSVTQAAAPAATWQSNLWDRLRKDFSLNHAAHQARVVSHKQSFIKNPKMFNDVSVRATPYLYYIAQELRARNLPMEFILIPVIESAYNPMAVSHAGAAGIWQLMPATARSLGVTQRNGHDGRRDVIASTEAALDYLTYLGQLFKQDWHLVLAAYNAGQGTVLRAMKRNRAAGKATDFWSLSSLPSETRNYVPKILALANLLKEKPGNFSIPVVPNQPQVNPVKIEKTHQLKEIANLSGVDVQKIKELNPSLKTQSTTQHADELLLPVKEAATLATALKTKPEVRETIPALADAKSEVVETVPAVVEQEAAAPVVVTPAVAVKEVAAPVQTTYKVRRGDSLNNIAKKFKVSLNDLAAWNKLNVKKPLQIGQSLVVSNKSKEVVQQAAAPATVQPAVATKATAVQSTKTTYKVRKGDSLNLIAQRFKVTIKDLTAWNKLNAKKHLYPGQAIVIYNKPVAA